MHTCMCFTLYTTYDISQNSGWENFGGSHLPKFYPESLILLSIKIYVAIAHLRMYTAALNALHKTEEEFGSQDKDKLVKVFHYV